MPERPDLEYVIPILANELAGARIEAVRVDSPVAVRVTVRGTAQELLTNKVIESVSRRAHFVMFALRDSEIELAVAPMLAGRFTIAPATAKRPRDLAFTLVLDRGREL